MTREKLFDYVGDCRLREHNEAQLLQYSNVETSDRLEKVLEQFGVYSMNENIPSYDTIEPVDIDNYNNDKGLALVDLNAGHVIATFIKGDTCIPKIKLSCNTYKNESGSITTYSSQDTSTKVEIYTDTYRPYVDVTVYKDRNGKPNVSRMSKFMSKARAKQIAAFTDYDIALVDLQTREIKDLDGTARTFADDC